MHTVGMKPQSYISIISFDNYSYEIYGIATGSNLNSIPNAELYNIDNQDSIKENL